MAVSGRAAEGLVTTAGTRRTRGCDLAAISGRPVWLSLGRRHFPFHFAPATTPTDDTPITKLNRDFGWIVPLVRQLSLITEGNLWTSNLRMRMLRTKNVNTRTGLFDIFNAVSFRNHALFSRAEDNNRQALRA